MMKKNFFAATFCAILLTLVFYSCQNTESANAVNTENTTNDEVIETGQSGVQDDVSGKDVVKVAVSSPEHTTLVQALKAAGLVDALSNAGPFTVFAPINAAFDELPTGTVANLMKPENKDALTDLLQYHVTVSVYDTTNLTDGRVLGEVNGKNVTIHRRDGNVFVNNAKILGSIRATNGIVHVIDHIITE